jgi:lipopolysaccharide export system permease protein
VTLLAFSLWRRWVVLAIGWCAVLAGLILALTVSDSLRWVRGADLGPVLQWVAMQVPAVVVRVMPVAALTATAITVGELVASRETVAMWAGGIRLGRIVRPWWPTLALVIAGSLAVSEWVTPWAEREASVLWWSITEDRPAMHRLVRQDLLMPQATSVRFERYEAATDRLRVVRVVAFDGDRVTVVTAESATWSANVLTLSEGSVVTLDLAALDRTTATPDRVADELTGGRSPLTTLELPEARSETVARYSGGTVGDGRSLSRQWFVAGDPGSAYVERRAAALRWHEKVASAFGSLTLAIATLTLAVSFARTVTRAFALASLAGLGWLIMAAAGQWLVVAGLVAPWVGAWSPHGVTLVVLAVALGLRR